MPRELAAGRLARLLGRGSATGPVPSTLIVVAHPDDETIGAGSLLPRLRHATFLHVTDGSPPDAADARAAGFDSGDAYAAERRRELLAALAIAGVDPDRARCVGIGDQRASFHLVAITRAVLELLRDLRPEIVLTHPYEGGHPDHDATALAVHLAVRLAGGENREDGENGEDGQRRTRRRGDAATRGNGWTRGRADAGTRGNGSGAGGRVRLGALDRPVIIEVASYHAGAGGMVAGEFLPARGVRGITVELDEAARELKRRLYAAYATQARVLEGFPIGVERFRPAPPYDFTRPPHAGRLWYENFDWGVTGERWRELAAEALAELGLAPSRRERIRSILAPDVRAPARDSPPLRVSAAPREITERSPAAIHDGSAGELPC